MAMCREDPFSQDADAFVFIIEEDDIPEIDLSACATPPDTPPSTHGWAWDAAAPLAWVGSYQQFRGLYPIVESEE
jgi:hypothetical protein